MGRKRIAWDNVVARVFIVLITVIGFLAALAIIGALGWLVTLLWRVTFA